MGGLITKTNRLMANFGSFVTVATLFLLHRSYHRRGNACTWFCSALIPRCRRNPMNLGYVSICVLFESAVGRLIVIYDVRARVITMLKGNVSVFLYLHSLRVSQGLHQQVPIFLVFGEIMPGSGDYCTIVTFILLVRLRTVRRHCQVFSTKHLA